MVIAAETICVLANPGSGRNSKDAAAIDVAMRAFGPDATLRRWQKGEDLGDAVRAAINDGFTTIVAAGGDGTVMGVATALMHSGVNLGVLPLGTFNYFARGLGLPQEPEPAAKAILNGHPKAISVGSVNGQVFLNNASLGVYPAILQAREDAYSRFGRSRLMAHWTALRTIARFQRPMQMELQMESETRPLRSPLIFVARSAYQLERFGLTGAQAISDDHFAVFIEKTGNRWELLKLAMRLVLGRVQVGRDVDLIYTRDMQIVTAKRRPKVAFDGEKSRMLAPLRFQIHDAALNIIVPDEADKVAA